MDNPIPQSVTKPLDYDPFGMLLVGRNWETNYRFGYNGKELDIELYGNGNWIDLGSRSFDTRLGRFFSVDPRYNEYAWQSTYCYFGNSPISVVDFNGEGDASDDRKYARQEKRKLNKFARKESLLAKRMGFTDYSTASDATVKLVRDKMENDYNKKRWMWTWTGDAFKKRGDDYGQSTTRRTYYNTRDIADENDGINARHPEEVVTEFPNSFTISGTTPTRFIDYSINLDGVNPDKVQFVMTMPVGSSATLAVNRGNVPIVNVQAPNDNFVTNRTILGPTSTTTVNYSVGAINTLNISIYNITTGSFTFGVNVIHNKTKVIESYAVTSRKGYHGFIFNKQGLINTRNGSQNNH